jgi:hypothetical protein
VVAIVALVALPFNRWYSLMAVLCGAIFGACLIMSSKKPRPNSYGGCAVVAVVVMQSLAATYFLPDARFRWSPYIAEFTAISLGIGVAIRLLYHDKRAKSS